MGKVQRLTRDEQIKQLLEAVELGVNLESLPFVVGPKEEGGGRDFWAPRPSGDYGRDCTLGLVYGRALLAYIRRGEAFNVLTQVVLAMVEHGNKKTDCGLIVGMMEVIQSAAAGRI